MAALIRVRAKLGSPIQASEPIALDGLLESVWWRRHPGREQPGRTDDLDGFWPHIGVGLTACGLRLASAWTPTEHGRPWLLTKRRDGVDVVRIARSFSARSGPGRDMMERRIVYPDGYVEWYAWGRKRAINRAVQLIHGLGGWRRHGLGQVDEWAIEAIDGSPLGAVVRDGIAQRSIPVRLCATVERSVWLATRAPYWHPQRVEEVAPPGSRVELTAAAIASIEAARCH